MKAKFDETTWHYLAPTAYGGLGIEYEKKVHNMSQIPNAQGGQGAPLVIPDAFSGGAKEEVSLAARCQTDGGICDAPTTSESTEVGQAPELTCLSEDELRRQLKKAHRSFLKSVKRAVKLKNSALLYAREAGRLLSSLTSPYGEIGKTRARLCRECGISPRTGNDYLNVFEKWDLISEKLKEDQELTKTPRLSLRKAISLLPKTRRSVPKLHHGLTPRWLLDNALGVLGAQEFTLDAAAESPQGDASWHVPAELHYTSNSIDEPWLGDVWVHLSPDMEIRDWVAKLAASLKGPDRVATCFLLLPLDIEATWFHQLALLAPSLCFFREPLTLHESVAPCRSRHVLAYIGPKREGFSSAFERFGSIAVCLGARDDK